VESKSNDKIGVAPALLSLEDAGEYCGISRNSFWKMKASGRCPAPIRLGRRLLWRKADLDRWILDGCPAVNRARAEKYRRDRENEFQELNKKETAS